MIETEEETKEEESESNGIKLAPMAQEFHHVQSTKNSTQVWNEEHSTEFADWVLSSSKK